MAAALKSERLNRLSGFEPDNGHREAFRTSMPIYLTILCVNFAISYNLRQPPCHFPEVSALPKFI